MCSLIYKLKFRSDVSNIIFTRNYIFHFGNEYSKLCSVSYMKVYINVSLISEVTFRVRKSYEVLRNFHRNVQVISRTGTPLFCGSCYL